MARVWPFVSQTVFYPKKWLLFSDYIYISIYNINTGQPTVGVRWIARARVWDLLKLEYTSARGQDRTGIAFGLLFSGSYTRARLTLACRPSLTKPWTWCRPDSPALPSSSSLPPSNDRQHYTITSNNSHSQSAKQVFKFQCWLVGSFFGRARPDVRPRWRSMYKVKRNFDFMQVWASFWETFQEWPHK